MDSASVEYKASLEAFDWLRERMGKLVETATQALEAATSKVGEWRDTMRSILMRYHIAAWMTGGSNTDLTPKAVETIKSTVSSQIDYLDKFAEEITAGKLTPEEMAARAQMYASGTQQSYWGGSLSDIPYPALPGQDTECMSNCRCSWRVEAVDSERGDYDLYWELGGARQHCGTCLWRSSNWSPYKVREGKLT